MSYQVVAPLVLARDKGRHVHHVYQGGVIDWLDDEQREHFVGTGLVVEIGAADSDDDKPGSRATNQELIAWLIENAVKEDGSEYSEADLDSLKKPELRALVDAVE